MEGFYRKEGRARKLLAKEKKRLFQAGSLSLMGEEQRSECANYLIFLWGNGKGPGGRLFGNHQKIS